MSRTAPRCPPNCFLPANLGAKPEHTTGHDVFGNLRHTLPFWKSQGAVAVSADLDQSRLAGADRRPHDRKFGRTALLSWRKFP
jgi:hypothetical protein